MASVWVPTIEYSPDDLPLVFAGSTLSRFLYHIEEPQGGELVCKLPLQIGKALVEEIQHANLCKCIMQIVPQIAHKPFARDIEQIMQCQHSAWTTPSKQLWPPPDDHDDGNGGGGRRSANMSLLKLMVTPATRTTKPRTPRADGVAKEQKVETKRKEKQSVAEQAIEADEIEDSEEERIAEGQADEKNETSSVLLVQEDMGEQQGAPGGPSSSSSSSGIDQIPTATMTAVSKPLPDRPTFYDIFIVRDGIEDENASAQLQPMVYTRKRIGFRYAVRCKLKGHQNCSRGRTWTEFSGESEEIVEQVLAQWIIEGIRNPDIKNTKDHMGLPRS